MTIDVDKNNLPENAQLKEYFSWRDTAVTEVQQRNLIIKISGEILLKGRFLAYLNLDPKPERVPDGPSHIKKGTKVTYFTLTANDKRVFYPVFTDYKEISAWKEASNEERSLVVLTFDDLNMIAKSNPEFSGVVINPFTDNFPLPSHTIFEWARLKADYIKDQQAKQQKGTDL